MVIMHIVKYYKEVFEIEHWKKLIIAIDNCKVLSWQSSIVTSLTDIIKSVYVI